MNDDVSIPAYDYGQSVKSTSPLDAVLATAMAYEERRTRGIKTYYKARDLRGKAEAGDKHAERVLTRYEALTRIAERRLEEQERETILKRNQKELEVANSNRLTAEEIVKIFAEGPLPDDDGECQFCASTPINVDVLEDHEGTCIWRQAVMLTEGL